MSKKSIVALCASVLSLNAAFADCGCQDQKQDAPVAVESTAANQETAAESTTEVEAEIVASN